jgi:hypothetical protein
LLDAHLEELYKILSDYVLSSIPSLYRLSSKVLNNLEDSLYIVSTLGAPS